MKTAASGVENHAKFLLNTPWQGLDSCGSFLPHKRKAPMFNETVKSLRLQKRLTLRDFCSQAGLDPSNWSKVERGVNPPPGDVGLLERLADFFGLAGAAKLAFIDEAALQRREIPADVAENAILQKALPAFFRAARGHELSEQELQNLAADIRKLHTSDAE
jgi:transcriptional regulator with XRE-family HTH domain